MVQGIRVCISAETDTHSTFRVTGGWLITNYGHHIYLLTLLFILIIGWTSNPAHGTSSKLGLADLLYMLAHVYSLI